ncbi:MAG: glucose-1-phosphate thymidylyltransferase [Crenarchaeota archaeon]|nr:glucose-1-phosphate thymidylyltransferase [Thermoproteota archaeon]
MQGLVLVAGEGTRLRPLTFTTPKPLIPVMGKPLVEYILEGLKESGITNICLVIGYLGNLFKTVLGDGSRIGVELSYVVQCERLGIAHAIHRAIEDCVIREEFVVHLGDNYFEEGISRFVKRFQEGDYDVFIVLTRYRDPRRFGYVLLQDGKVVRLIEKPIEPPPGGYTLTGLYMFRDPDLVEKAFRELKPSQRGEYEITDLIQWFIDKGYNVGYDITNGWWKDTGTPDDMLELVNMMLDKIETRTDGEVRGKIIGRVIVEKDAIIDGEVYGPAYIGEGAYIDKKAKIEHYVDVEANCEITSGQISRSLILPEARIETNNARIIDSIIGRKAEIKLNTGQYKIISGDFTIIYNY